MARSLLRALHTGWLLALVTGAGCRREIPEAERRAQAEDAVRRFFTALPSGDCAVLGAMLAPGPKGQGCQEQVEELNSHRVRLLSVLGSTVDGRAPDAVIVRTQMEQQGQPRAQPTLVRVERQGKGWRIRL